MSALDIPGRPALPPIPRLAAAILPVALVTAVGSLSTGSNIEEWYTTIRKPAFNPAELGVSAGLDRSLHADRDLALAAARRPPGAGPSPEGVVAGAGRLRRSARPLTAPGRRSSSPPTGSVSR
jgi:hypothetical protein